MNGSIRTAALGIAAALTLGSAASQAQAAVVYATSVDAYTAGANVAGVRGQTARALGAEDGKFLSLGIGGSATFSFGSTFNAIGKVFEITFGSRQRTLESVDIFGSLDGVRFFLGSITNGDDGTFSFAGLFDQLTFVDTTSVIGSIKNDGFDIDAIRVTPAPVPLPAGGLLLLGALGAVLATKRRAV